MDAKICIDRRHKRTIWTRPLAGAEEQTGMRKLTLSYDRMMLPWARRRLPRGYGAVPHFLQRRG